MPHLRVNLLGKPEIWLNGTRLAGFNTTKSEALFYYLVVSGRAHSRETLAGLFWGEMPETNAKRNLSKALQDLRRDLSPFLLVEPRSIALDNQAAISLDVAEFEAAADLVAVVDLYRGDFLQGLHVKDALAFEEWVVVERERLREKMVDTLDKLVGQCAARGVFGDGVKYARRLLELDPWRETAHRELMSLLSRMGQHNAAIAQYDNCRKTLLEELGVEPMPETTALYERILAARKIHIHPLPADTEPLIGRKAECEHLKELFADPACRLVSLVGLGGMGKTRLALAFAREINQEGALRFINGAAFISLADVAEPAALPLKIADGLNLSLMDQSQVTRALLNYLKNKEMLVVLDNFEQLLAGVNLIKQILSTCPYVKILVTSREPLQLTSEWRVDLGGLAFPQIVEEASLQHGTPVGFENDPEMEYPAVQMFIQSARQISAGYGGVEEDYSSIYRLCQMVSGMPLALKVAASWVRVMSVAQIVDEVGHCLDVLSTQMHDVPERQRSIRAIIDSTWRQLNEEEQRAFQAFAVFRGGFSRQAADRVAGATLYIFASLIEKSLVSSTGKDRFGMHDLLFQFAREKLDAQEDAQALCQTRHSVFYLSFISERADQLNGPDQQKALVEIGEDLGNILAAWKFAVLQNDLDAIHPAVDALFNYFKIRSRFEEGESIFGWTVTHLEEKSVSHPARKLLLPRLIARRAALQLACHDVDPAEASIQQALETLEQPEDRAFAFTVQGGIALERGNRSLAREYLQEGYRISQKINDHDGMLETLLGLADSSAEFGDFRQAQTLASKALEISQKLNLADRVARSLGILSWASCCLGDYIEAEKNWQGCMNINQQIGNRLGIAINTSMLGWVAWCMSREQEALEYHEQAFATFRTEGYRDQQAMSLADMALVWMDLEDHERAMQCARDGYAVAKETDSAHFHLYTHYVLGAATFMAGDLETGKKLLLEALEKARTMQKADNFMSALFFTARLFLREAEKNSNSAELIEKVFEMLTLIILHPATWQVFRDRAIALRKTLFAEYPNPFKAASDSFTEELDWQAWAERFLHAQTLHP